MSIEKIEIPKEPTPGPKSPMTAAEELAELMKIPYTEERKFIPLDKFKWTTDLTTDSVFAIIRKIQNEPEVIQNLWHFIPYDNGAEKEGELKKKKYWMQFFCVDDKKVLKKYTKVIKRYFPGVSVNWEPFDAVEYKKALEEAKKSNNNS